MITSEAQMNTSEQLISTSEPQINTLEQLINTSEPQMNTSEQLISTSEPQMNTSEKLISTSGPQINTSGKLISTSELQMSTSEAIISTSEVPPPTSELPPAGFLVAVKGKKKEAPVAAPPFPVSNLWLRVASRSRFLLFQSVCSNLRKSIWLPVRSFWQPVLPSCNNPAR